MGRIGLLGGTFDPPHIGHMVMAECARTELGLDQVLFLPVGQPVHKRGEPITLVRHRLAMTRLAVAGNDSLVADTTDIDRPPPHTTVTMLDILQQRWPGASFWLLIGADSLADLAEWWRPDLLIQKCHLAVMPRPGSHPDLLALESAIPGLSERVGWLDAPPLAISSTDIRNRLCLGRSVRYLLPDAVHDYIKHHALYLLGS